MVIAVQYKVKFVLKDDLEKSLNEIVKEKGKVTNILSDHTSQGIMYTVVYAVKF